MKCRSVVININIWLSYTCLKIIIAYLQLSIAYEYKISHALIHYWANIEIFMFTFALAAYI